MVTDQIKKIQTSRPQVGINGDTSPIIKKQTADEDDVESIRSGEVQ